MFLGMLLKDRIKLYTKEDLKAFAYDIGLTGLSRLRKDALVDAIVERLLEPDVMFYRMSIFDNKALVLFEKGIGSSYICTEEEYDTACIFDEMDFAAVSVDKFYVFDDVAEVWKKVRNKKFETYRKRASWVWKCLHWTEGMYGFTPIENFLDVINTKKGFRMTETELIEIFDHFPEDRLLTIRFDDIFLETGLAVNEESMIHLRKCQGNKDYYIPSVSEVEEFFQTEALLSAPVYQKAKRYLINNLHTSEEDAEEILLVLWEKITTEDDLHGTIQWFLNQFSFESDSQVQKAIDLLMSVINGTRSRNNRGHTPEEIPLNKRFGPGNMPVITAGSSHAAELLAQAAPDIKRMGFGLDLESNAANLQVMHMPDGADGPVTITQKKVYPNDPCPCGSGKKYKKRCGRKR